MSLFNYWWPPATSLLAPFSTSHHYSAFAPSPIPASGCAWGATVVAVPLIFGAAPPSPESAFKSAVKSLTPLPVPFGFVAEVVLFPLAPAAVVVLFPSVPVFSLGMIVMPPLPPTLVVCPWALVVMPVSPSMFVLPSSLTDFVRIPLDKGKRLRKYLWYHFRPPEWLLEGHKLGS